MFLMEKVKGKNGVGVLEILVGMIVGIVLGSITIHCIAFLL